MCSIAEDIKKDIKKPEETTFKVPTLKEGKEQNRHTEANKIENSTAAIYFNKEIDQYIKHYKTYQENKTKIFMVIIGQCTNMMILKLGSYLNWNEIDESSGVVQLLTTIKDIAYK
eukprot:6423987-Ditylum_brightwellii.AAC.1